MELVVNNTIYVQDKIGLTPYVINSLLNNLKFNLEQATYVDIAKAWEELNIIARYVQQDQTTSIRLGGHTSIGNSNDKKMQRLSDQRVKQVKQDILSLLSISFSPKRIVGQGYGRVRPRIWRPKTDQEKAENRRVEVIVICKD